MTPDRVVVPGDRIWALGVVLDGEFVADFLTAAGLRQGGWRRELATQWLCDPPPGYARVQGVWDGTVLRVDACRPVAPPALHPEVGYPSHWPPQPRPQAERELIARGLLVDFAAERRPEGMVYFGLATDVDACLCVLRPLYPEATIELIKARYSLSELTGMRALLDEVTERADQAGGGYVTDESRQLQIAERYVRIGPSLARVITELPPDALCIATQLQPQSVGPRQ